MIIFIFLQEIQLEWNQSYANGRGGLKVSWNPFSTEKSYLVSRSKNNSPFEAISAMDFTDDVVNVINIYPCNSESSQNIPKSTFQFNNGSTASFEKSGSVKVWMEGGSINGVSFTGVGKFNGVNKIHVTPISSKDFNLNPSIIHNYDVILFGIWDANNIFINPIDNQPNEAALSEIIKFLDAGGGFYAGHDTVVIQNSLSALAEKYFGFRLTTTYPQISSNTVTIKRQGLLTNFPHDLGPIGTKLYVTSTHAQRQEVINEAEVWMKLETSNPSKNSIFLIGKGNCAFSQTGHSNCESTLAERQIMANTLFSLKQKSSKTNIIDNSAWDYQNPKQPILIDSYFTSTFVNFKIKIEDEGTAYRYQVNESSGQTITMTEDYLIKSGIDKICYLIDREKNSIINETTENLTCQSNSEQIDYLNEIRVSTQNLKSQYYFHCAGIDRMGNIGETLHLKIDEFQSRHFSRKINKKQKMVSQILCIFISFINLS